MPTNSRSVAWGLQQNFGSSVPEFPETKCDKVDDNKKSLKITCTYKQYKILDVASKVVHKEIHVNVWKTDRLTKMAWENITHHRVETYWVYGGIDDTSLASPKSAILRTSFVTSKFSAQKKTFLLDQDPCDCFDRLNRKYKHNNVPSEIC